MLLWSRCCCICVVAALLLYPRVFGVDFCTVPVSPIASPTSPMAKSSESEVVIDQTNAEDVDAFAAMAQQTRGSQTRSQGGARQQGRLTNREISEIVKKHKSSSSGNRDEMNRKISEEIRDRTVRGGVSEEVPLAFFEDEATEEQEGGCWFATQSVYSARSKSRGSGMPGRTMRFGMKVCGAWPSCGNCSTLYTGDCKYIFPTYVTVYEKRDENNGRSKLCACKVLACNLPWDPSGWNKSCFAELGCFNKPFLRAPGPFCPCLQGKDRMKVKFVPLQFSEQSFWRPGIVAIVEQSGRVSGKSTYGVSKHIIRPIGDSVEDQSTQKTGPLKEGYQYHTHGPAIRMIYQDYSFKSDGIEHYLKLRRSRDSICVKYYGTDSERVTELLEECLPIPHMPIPRVYRAARNVEVGYSQSKYSVLSENYAVAKKIGGVYYESAKQHYVKQDTEHYTDTVSNRVTELHEPGKQRFVSYVEKESGKKAVVAYEGIFKSEEISGKVPNLGDQDTYILPFTTSRKRQVGYVFRECIGFPGEEKCHEDTEGVSSVYDHAVGSFRGYSRKWFKDDSLGAVVGAPKKSGPLRFIDVALYDAKEREIVEICVPGIHIGRDNCVRGGSVTPAPGVKCIFGEENDAPEYEIFGTGAGKLWRLWLRRHPSVFRRYVLVGAGENTRHVPCDDRYTVNLRTLNQQTMDSMSISEGQFSIRGEAAGDSVKGGGDLCAQPKFGVVYYYEPGKFATEAEDLATCKNRSVQYYSPEGKVESCTYEYMNLSDYSSVSLGDHVSGKSPLEGELDLRPLNIYDRGMCVDNFPRAWYKPEYRVRDKQAELVSKEYVIAGPFALGQGLGTLFGRSCQFLKIEAWGGGEAAMGESRRDTSRSGRPGQYIMSILHDPGDSDSIFLSHASLVLKSVLMESAHTSGKSASLQPKDLVFWIVADVGEGGEHGKPKKQERHQGVEEYYVHTKEDGQWSTEERIDKRTNVTYGGGTGAGGDTVVKLCMSMRNALNSGEGVQDEVKQGSAWDKIPANKVLCHEMMRAVGGGSERAGGVNKGLIANLVLSYRTITGDVLANDYRAHRLMLEGHGMFTKFPLEMNFPITSAKEKELQVNDYFEGRSLPMASCKYRSRYSKWSNGDIFVPGMGGCWNRDKSGTVRDKPGLGQSGAVMVTCEQWTGSFATTETVAHAQRERLGGSEDAGREAQPGRAAQAKTIRK
ncbi:MAG: hypothetical protein ACTJLK_00015 [Anaplasma sp.]